MDNKEKIVLKGEDFVELMQNIPMSIIRRFAESYGMLGIDDKVSILKQTLILPCEKLYVKMAAKTVELYWVKIECIELLNKLSSEELRRVLNGDFSVLKIKNFYPVEIIHIVHNINIYRYYYGIDN